MLWLKFHMQGLSLGFPVKQYPQERKKVRDCFTLFDIPKSIRTGRAYPKMLKELADVIARMNFIIFERL